MFEHLRLFVDIVHAKSLSRGAALSRVSQPAASQHLHELEMRLGVVLLDRSTRPFTLTAAGRLYYEFARDVLGRKENFDVALEALKAEVEGTVRVASIYSVGLSEMSHLKEEFSKRWPKARLEVEYLRPEKVYEAVLTDRADLGLVSYAEPSKQLAAIPWRREQMVAAAAASHPLARREVVRASDLQGLDFVAFDEDLPIRHEIDRFLREHGIEVSIAMHFDNIQMVKEAVAVNSGISILPRRVLLDEIRQGRVVAIPLDAELVRPLGIIHRRRKKFHRAAESFLTLLQEQPLPEPEPVGATGSRS